VGYKNFIGTLLPFIMEDVKTLAFTHYESFRKVFVTDLKWIKVCAMRWREES